MRDINGHVDNGNWELVDKSTVPKDQEVLPSVWAMRRKRDLVTDEITKYKARLNLHGGMQAFGVNYFDTYAHVVTWMARFCLTLAIINRWKLRHIDFIMAYPQAPIEVDMWMKIPHKILPESGEPKNKCLKLLQNIYGQKQARHV